MITTPDLIEALASDLRPVRRLRPPLVRAGGWLLLAALVLTLLAISEGTRSDLGQRLHDASFVASMTGALSTGILAAIAAFMLSLPDRSRFWWCLPLPGLVLWLLTIGYQCLTNWVSVSWQLGETARCFATLVLTSLPLSLVMLVMLRYAAPLRPTSVILTGGLAVAGITAAALALFHNLDASLMILMWNMGTAALIVGLAGTFGRRMLSWVAPRTVTHRG